MDRKRPAVEETEKQNSFCEDDDDEATTTTGAAAKVVTPEKATKKQKPCDANVDAHDNEGNEEEDRKPEAVAKPEIDNEEVVEDNDGQQVVEEEEEPEPAAAAAEEEEEEEGITGDTVMGFPSHATRTNRELMLNSYGFVTWAKKKRNEASEGLLCFLNWVDSDEGQQLEGEVQARETFGFGQHNGETFREIAAEDPGYHGRYMRMLHQRNQRPNGVLVRYIEWFNRHGPGPVRAQMADRMREMHGGYYPIYN